MSTGAMLCRPEHVCYRQEHAHKSIVVSTGALSVGMSIVLSTLAMPCRPVHSIIGRSMPTGVLWFWRLGGRSTVLSQSDRSMILAVGALFCRQEHCFVDRRSQSDKSLVLLAGALFCRQELGFVDRSNAMSTAA